MISVGLVGFADVLIDSANLTKAHDHYDLEKLVSPKNHELTIHDHH